MIGKLFFPFLVELESVGTELNLYADRRVSAEEMCGKNAGILEAQVHSGATRPETLAHDRGVAAGDLAQYCRLRLPPPSAAPLPLPKISSVKDPSLYALQSEASARIGL